jgi:hypothetical protein
MFVAHCQIQVVDLSSDARYAVFIPDDIADIAILRLNKMLTNIIEGKHRLQITPALLGAQAGNSIIEQNQMQDVDMGEN